MISATMFEPARVWLRRGALDRRLAFGADPSSSPALSRRARQLISPRFRARLAHGIYNVIDSAEVPGRAYSSAVPVNRREVLTERSLLVELADSLLSDEELNPRGVALVERLLVDGESPVYAGSCARTLHEAATQARAALHLR